MAGTNESTIVILFDLQNAREGDNSYGSFASISDTGTINGEMDGGAYKMTLDKYFNLHYDSEGTGEDIIAITVWVKEGLLDIPRPTTNYGKQKYWGWRSNETSPFVFAMDYIPYLYNAMNNNNINIVYAENTKANGYELFLDCTTVIDWHKTGSDIWYFDGPYYCDTSKFQYHTSGLKSSVILVFQIENTEIKVDNLAANDNWTVIPEFKGDFNKNAASIINYLNPNSYYDAKLYIKASPKDFVIKKFMVKDRIIFWVDDDLPIGRVQAYECANLISCSVSNNPNSNSKILLFRNADEWSTAYNCLTVKGYLHSIGHGIIDVNDENEIVYGGIYLPFPLYSYRGFGEGTEFNDNAYNVEPLGLWELNVWIRHCWTAECSGDEHDGLSVAKSLHNVLKIGPGSSTTRGYLGIYKEGLATVFRFDNCFFTPSNASLTTDNINEVINEEFVNTLESLENGSLIYNPAIYSNVEASAEQVLINNYNLTSCNISNLALIRYYFVENGEFSGFDNNNNNPIILKGNEVIYSDD